MRDTLRPRCCRTLVTIRHSPYNPAFAKRSPNDKTFSDPGPRELFVQEVPRVLLHLQRHRGHEARHRAPRAAFRPHLCGGRGALHETGPEEGQAAAAPPQGHDLRLGMHDAGPGAAPLHRIRYAAGPLPHISRKLALRLLRVPQVRARATGRRPVRCPDLAGTERPRSISRFSGALVARVANVAHRLLQLAERFLHEALGFHPGAAEGASGILLQLARQFLRTSFHLIPIHSRLLSRGFGRRYGHRAGRKDSRGASMIPTRVLLVAAALSLSCGNSYAQQASPTAWPSRPVKIMVGASPGGGTDIIARMLADKFQAAFGQVFVVENRPGAGNTIAADVTARAAPDGHTLLVATNSAQAIAPHMMKLGFDPIRDIAPIALIVVVPNVLAVAPTVTAGNVRELIAQIKAKPGEFSCGSSGIGSTQHLACEAFAMATGTKIVHIPYKGSAPALTDLIGGPIQLAFGHTSPATRLIQRGQN